MSAADAFQGFRLILSDSLSGGQRVKTFNHPPSSLKEVVAFLGEHFDFKKLCELHGLALTAEAGLRMQGLDGPRRIPIRDDAGLAAFFQDLQNTRLPTIEVRLAPRSSLVPAVPPEGAHQGGRGPQDRLEQMEEENFRFNRGAERVERRLAEVERLLLSSKDDNQRIIDIAAREMQVAQDKALSALQTQIDAMKERDAERLRALEVLRNHAQDLDQRGGQTSEDLAGRLSEFRQLVDAQILEIQRELETRRAEAKRLDQECLAIKRECKTDFASYRDEIDRLEQIKVDKEDWRRHAKALADKTTQETEALSQSLQEAVTSLTERLGKEERETKERVDEVRRVATSGLADCSRSSKEHLSRVDDAIDRLNSEMQDGIKHVGAKVTAVHSELQSEVSSKVNGLMAKLEKDINETRSYIIAKDGVLTQRLEALSVKTEADTHSHSERLEELSRVERARLGAMERELAETATKIRSDVRSDMERIRTVNEQEAARLDTDLSDLHMKHDVTKQEINFVQSRLQEQREWAQRELASASTATRAAVVDAQEGHSATSKMLHALRDDTVAFREKMAKYISLLQHSSDSQGDAVNLLETQRTRIRADLEVLIKEHKAYTTDMDSWADDVRVKVERLFRAMEPARTEWRIARAHVRAKELKRPLAVKSPTFALRGLREARLEFYPDGHGNSPDGKAVLRVLMPGAARVRFQCWLGRSSDGPKEFVPSSPTDAFMDLYVEQWKEQIQDDGSVSVAFEVLRDYEHDDESLCREVRMESK